MAHMIVLLGVTPTTKAAQVLRWPAARQQQSALLKKPESFGSGFRGLAFRG